MEYSQLSMKIIPGGMGKALILIESLHHPYETNRIYKGDLSVQLSTTQISKKWWTAQMLFKGNFQDLGKFWKILNFQNKQIYFM